MAERNLETSLEANYDRRTDGRTGGQTEKATYRSTSYRSAQKSSTPFEIHVTNRRITSEVSDCVGLLNVFPQGSE